MELFFQYHIGISLFLNPRTIRGFSLYNKCAASGAFIFIHISVALIPEGTRCGSPRRRRRAGGLPTVGARGSAPSPLRSRNQIFRMPERNAMRGAYPSIRLRGLARALLLSQAAGRRLPPFLRFALPRHQSLSPRLAADTLSISAINYCRYCRIFDTAFRYF